ncbi:MAG TPA: hypothetical protein PKC39_01355 [Ferruginibacter sp.]|nr:hypothetical protein [Ferruginibacter sp.]HMP19580.1 hypothetical protein [Ferruginibacter sp.]
MFSKADIERYFIAEKIAGLVFLCLGIAAVILALVFFFGLKTNFYKGAAIPLFIVGLIITSIGFTIYNRSDADRIRNTYAYDMNPGELKNKELPRMQKVLKNFVLVKYAEVALLIVGLFLFIYHRNSTEHIFWKGFGLTLAIMAVIALAADYAAEKRAKTYSTGLSNFVNR